MCKLKAFFIGIIVSLSSTIFVYSQNSPYSIRGVGDLGSMELPHNIAMGGIGLSQPHNLYLNNMNPALLPNNTLTNFGLGVMSDYKRISNQNTSTTNLGGGLSYLTFAFPIVAGKWTLSSGLIPYSTVDYSYQVVGSVVPETNTTVNYDYSGEGGISRAFIANGFQLSKRFAVGFQVNYLFGSIINETGTEIEGADIPSAYRTVVYDRTRFSDFSVKGGLSFHQQVKGRTFFNAGLIYELGGDINSNQLVRLERKTLSNATWQSLSMDTIANAKGSVSLPSTLGFGVSLFKNFHWTVGTDITLQNWSTFRNFNGSNGDMVNSYRIGLGGEYTPEISSIDSYFKRITYRMGFNYENTPFQINDEQVRDFGINFGISLPVSRFSSLDMAFRLGQRGAISNDLIREDYFRVFLGVTFNDKWFQRRKFD
jgi:hypothetical protein